MIFAGYPLVCLDRLDNQAGVDKAQYSENAQAMNLLFLAARTGRGSDPMRPSPVPTACTERSECVGPPRSRAASLERSARGIPRSGYGVHALLGNLHGRKTRWLSTWRKTKKTNLCQTIKLETNQKTRPACGEICSTILRSSMNNSCTRVKSI